MRFLIVDDNVAQTESLILLLRMHGHESMGATNLLAAEQLVEVHPPDVVLLDVVMPQENGLALLAWLRAREDTRQVPVIVSSALPREDLPPLPTKDPQLWYLPKPFSYEELLETAGIALGNSGAGTTKPAGVKAGPERGT